MNCFKLPFSLNFKPLNNIKQDCMDCLEFYISILGLQEDGDYYDYDIYKNKSPVTMQPQEQPTEYSRVINMENME